MNRRSHRRLSAHLAGWALFLGFWLWVISGHVEGGQPSLHTADEEAQMDTNQQIIIQEGLNNRKTVTQGGEHLDLRLEQRGIDNDATIKQQGSNNQAESIQEGDRNRSRIRQKGSGNRATIRQGSSSQTKKRETP